MKTEYLGRQVANRELAFPSFHDRLLVLLVLAKEMDQDKLERLLQTCKESYV